MAKSRMPRVRWLLAAVAVGAFAVSASAIAYSATAEDVPVDDYPGEHDIIADDPKRTVTPVRPGAVTLAGLPPGQGLPDGITAPIAHGRMLVAPGGQVPNAPAGATLFDNVETYETTVYDLYRRDAWPVDVADSALPAGYAVTHGASTTAIMADGTHVLTEMGISVEGDGHPIQVMVWVSPYLLRGAPYPIPAWNPDAVLMTTIGEIAGVPAVFEHRRPGSDSPQRQTVSVVRGDYIVVVEGYVDEFAKLMRVSESVLSRMEAIPSTATPLR